MIGKNTRMTGGNIIQNTIKVKLIIEKMKALMYLLLIVILITVKEKIKVVKWFLMNVKKASKYLIKNCSLSFVDGKMIYVFKVDGAIQTIEIRHPKVKMDVPDYIQFQRNVLLLFDFLRSKYIEE